MTCFVLPVLMEWITWFSFEPSISQESPELAKKKGRYSLRNENSDPGSVQVHPGLRWTLHERSRVRLPAVNAIQAVVTVTNCGVKPDTFRWSQGIWVPTCSLASWGLEHLTLKVFLLIPTDKNHSRKLEKNNRSPDKQLKLLAILRAIPCILVECSAVDCATCQASGAKPVTDCR